MNRIKNKCLRRTIKTLILIAVLTSVYIFYKLCLPNVVFFWGNQARLEIDTGSYKVSEVLSDSDSNKIRNMFVGKINWFDEPACGFEESNYIEFGNSKFVLGMDSCGTIKTGNRYFELSEDEFNELNNILRKYNAEFPLF